MYANTVGNRIAYHKPIKLDHSGSNLIEISHFINVCNNIFELYHNTYTTDLRVLLDAK